MNRRKFLIASGVVVTSTALAGFYWPRRWKYIVIHHSAGNYGTIEFLQQVHRERQAGDPIDAIPYHYVIGNGNGLGMGEVASDWRQGADLWGAHVSGNNMDRNLRGIGICLIGNYEENHVPKRQYDELLRLTRQLMSEYSISADNVHGHGHVEGEQTKCPGRNFPMKKFRKQLQV